MPDKTDEDFVDIDDSEGVSHAPTHDGDDPFAEQRALAKHARRVQGEQHKAKLKQGPDATIPDL